MTDDIALLQAYVESDSQEAFRELVHRHVDFVYATACRQGGGAARAEDITQTVFLALARKAPQLLNRRELVGWLHQCTTFAAKDVVRREARRSAREQAAPMNPPAPASPTHELAWRELEGVVDTVLQELPEQDRTAVLLRYFKDQSFAGIAATLRLSEDAARKRVERALDKLRPRLARHGITSTPTALAAALASHTGISAPAGLAVSVTSAVALGLGTSAATTATAATSILTLMSTTTKTALAVAGIVALAVIATVVVQSRKSELAFTSDSSAASAPFAENQVDPAASPESLDSVAFQREIETTTIRQSSPDTAWDFADELAAEKDREEERQQAAQAANQSLQSLLASRARFQNVPAPESDVVDSAALERIQDEESALAYFRDLPPENRLPVLRYLQALPSTEHQVLLVRALYRVWTSDDSGGAMAAAALGNPIFLRTAVAEWARIDARSAWSWAEAASPSERMSLRTSVIRGATEANEEPAIGQLVWELAALPEPRSGTREAMTLVTSWIKKDPLAASTWVRDLAALYPDEASGALISIGFNAPALSPAQFDAVLAQQTEANQEPILSSAVGRWVSEDQIDRIQNFLESHPDLSDDRYDLVLEAFGTSVQASNPDIALATLQDIRDPAKRDEQLHAAAVKTTIPVFVDGEEPTSHRPSPETGMQFAFAIADRELQADAVFQNYRRWAEEDPAAARAFIEQEDFPADFRAGLLALGL